MTALNKTALVALINDPNGPESVEELATWCGEIIAELAGRMEYVPYLDSGRSYANSITRDFDGTGTYRTSVRFSLPSNVAAASSPIPMWKSMENTITLEVPARYYVA